MIEQLPDSVRYEVEYRVAHVTIRPVIAMNVLYPEVYDGIVRAITGWSMMSTSSWAYSAGKAAFSAAADLGEMAGATADGIRTVSRARGEQELPAYEAPEACSKPSSRPSPGVLLRRRLGARVAPRYPGGNAAVRVWAAMGGMK